MNIGWHRFWHSVSIWLRRYFFVWFIAGISICGGLISPSARGQDMEWNGKTHGCDSCGEIERRTLVWIQAEDPVKQIEGLLERGERFRSLGHYRDARMDFLKARQIADTIDHSLLETVATEALGYVYFLEGNVQKGETALRAALEKAARRDQPILAASCANRLGNLLLDGGQHADALLLYQKALTFASRSADPALAATVHINLARIAEDTKQVAVHLEAAHNIAGTIRSPEEHAQVLLEMAVQGKQLKDDRGLGFRHEVLHKAFQLATAIRAERLLSRAAGDLGAVYESRGRLKEARSLTEQALLSAQRLWAHDLMLKWESQLGRIFRVQGHPAKAIAAYRRAIYHIRAIRRDLSVRYHDGCSSFRERFAPVYLCLADMLLLQAAAETDQERRQNLLREARETVEQIRRSEIRDYFNDPCIDARSREVALLPGNTAVVYPIVLTDRLELLTDVDNRLYQRTVPVTETTLRRQIMHLVKCLRRPDSFYQRAGQELYEWLIRPVVPILEKHDIDTLVYAPDGPLRLLPVAALWNGKRFLIEDYAVATVPGLTLLDPNPLPRDNLNTILGGMSQAGPVIWELPDSLWNRLATSRLTSWERGIRGFHIVSVAPAASRISSETRSEKSFEAANVQKALALPGVQDEICRLSEILEPKVMMNQNFQMERFAADFKNQDYRIVHIASHGFFGDSPEESFIMTYDRLLDMDDLETLIKPGQLSPRPVELIVLSACQTAEGNDQAPLGLIGVALKSGARSGIGSLWPVSDNATQKLLPAFYRYLKDQNTSKAQALRQACLELIRDKRFAHPFFWSAFILVGNWL
jgi:CHAT domain-containing protein